MWNCADVFSRSCLEVLAANHDKWITKKDILPNVLYRKLAILAGNGGWGKLGPLTCLCLSQQPAVMYFAKIQCCCSGKYIIPLLLHCLRYFCPCNVVRIIHFHAGKWSNASKTRNNQLDLTSKEHFTLTGWFNSISKRNLLRFTQGDFLLPKSSSEVIANSRGSLVGVFHFIVSEVCTELQFHPSETTVVPSNMIHVVLSSAVQCSNFHDDFFSVVQHLLTSCNKHKFYTIARV